jgi:transposase
LAQELRQRPYHTAKEVVAWVQQQFGVTYSERGMEKLLGRLDFTWQKVRLVPGKAAAAAQEQFVADYERMRAEAGPEDRLYFVDGVHPMYNVHPGKVWAPAGQRPEQASNSGRQRYNILGAYCPLDQEYVDEQTTGSLNAQTVIQLIDKLRARHPTAKRLVFFLDNVRYHHARLVREHCAGTNVEFVFLPPYAPNLNLIERLWKFLKGKVLRWYYAAFESFVSAIQDFLAHLDRYREELASLMTERFEIIAPRT